MVHSKNDLCSLQYDFQDIALVFSTRDSSYKTASLPIDQTNPQGLLFLHRGSQRDKKREGLYWVLPRRKSAEHCGLHTSIPILPRSLSRVLRSTITIFPPFSTILRCSDDSGFILHLSLPFVVHKKYTTWAQGRIQKFMSEIRLIVMMWVKSWWWFLAAWENF